MRHVISVLIENEVGALSRVAGLFSARGYNIETLTAAPTEDQTLSRMTIVTQGDENIIEQITKQLNKLIDVVKLIDLAEVIHAERELMLVKVKAVGSRREEVKLLSEIFCGKIIDVTTTSYIIEMIGPSDKLDAFIAVLDKEVIIEVVRSGSMGISRGEKGLYLQKVGKNTPK